MICDAKKSDYLKLIEIWELSVRVTHNFLPEAEIEQLKTLILNKYFDAVTLKCYKNTLGEILGFCGIAGKKIEMLFVAPNVHGQGIGSALCQYAIQHHGATQVDVNEQNPRALNFYKKMGFTVISRSERDGQGRPYPLLHMQL